MLRHAPIRYATLPTLVQLPTWLLRRVSPVRIVWRSVGRPRRCAMLRAGGGRGTPSAWPSGDTRRCITQVKTYISTQRYATLYWLCHAYTLPYKCCALLRCYIRYTLYTRYAMLPPRALDTLCHARSRHTPYCDCAATHPYAICSTHYAVYAIRGLFTICYTQKYESSIYIACCVLLFFVATVLEATIHAVMLRCLATRGRMLDLAPL